MRLVCSFRQSRVAAAGAVVAKDRHDLACEQFAQHFPQAMQPVASRKRGGLMPTAIATPCRRRSMRSTRIWRMAQSVGPGSGIGADAEPVRPPKIPAEGDTPHNRAFASDHASTPPGKA